MAVGSFVRETYGAQVSRGFTCPAGQLRRCNPLCFVDDRGPWGVGRSLFSFRATASPSPALIPPEISQKSFSSMKRSRDSSTGSLLRPFPTACTSNASRRRIHSSETAVWLNSKIPMVPSYLINSIINQNKREKQSELTTKMANPMDSRYTKHFRLGCISAIASASVRVRRNKVSAVYLCTSRRRGEFVPLRGRNCRR